jgi:hypothetical protein
VRNELERNPRGLVPPYKIRFRAIRGHVLFTSEFAGLRVEPSEPQGGIVRPDKPGLEVVVTEGCARRASLTTR